MKWRKMATAPKDGTRILIWDGSPFCAWWDDNANFGDGELTKPGWQIFNNEMDSFYSMATETATHWMPLPKAP
jgi:hypothetical protein